MSFKQNSFFGGGGHFKYKNDKLFLNYLIVYYFSFKDSIISKKRIKRKAEILHKKVIFKAFFNIKQTHRHIYMKDGVIFAS